MENQKDHLKNVGVMDDWGKCADLRMDDGVSDLNWAFTRGGIEIEDIHNAPLITRVSVDLSEDGSIIDFRAAGHYIAESEFVVCLSVHMGPSCSRENILSFFGRMNLNRSIRHMKIIDLGCHGHDVFCLLDAFFTENTNLESLSVQFSNGTNGDAIQAMNNCVYASSSIKSIVIKRCGRLDDAVVEKIFETVCGKPGLRHLSIVNYNIPKKAHLALSALLSKKDCELESLMLQSVKTHNEEFTEITNSSVKRLRIWNWQGDLCSIQWNALETLDLSFLTSAMLSNVLETSRSALRELKITGSELNDELLARLASSLRNNLTLKKLDLTCSYRDTDVIQVCTSLHKTQVEEFTLDVQKSNAILRALATYLASNTTLRVLKCNSNDIDLSLFGGDNISPQTWRLFSHALGPHPCIEELDIQRISDTIGTSDIEAIMISRLKQLNIRIIHIDQLLAIVHSLEQPTCSLEKLDLDCSGADDSLQDPQQYVQQIAYALCRNTAMKRVSIKHYRAPFEFDKALFTQLLCNQPSIDATYDSNHTLEFFEVNCKQPAWLRSMLQMNKGTNKHWVARQKIIQTHTFQYVDFEPSSLPLVLSWVGNATSNEHMRLAQCYSVVRKAACLVRKENAKYLDLAESSD